MNYQIYTELKNISNKLDSLSFTVDEPDVVDDLEDIKDGLAALNNKLDKLIDVNTQILESLQDKK
jgi:hypothetical protein